jgi:hypothetical protein
MSPRFVVRSLSLPVLLFMGLLPAFAQQTGGGGGAGSGGGGGSAGGSTGSITPTYRPTVGNASDASKPTEPPKLQMFFVFGVVVMEDGSQVPMGTGVERSCGGRPVIETYVAANGTFSFSMGGPGSSVRGSMFADASQDLNEANAKSFGRTNLAMPTTLMGCEIRAHLPGYRSSRITLNGNHTVGQVNAGTIVLAPVARVLGSQISATDLSAPKSAKKALMRAQKAFHDDRLPEAEKQLTAAVKEFPRYASGWLGLGQVYQKQNRLAEARNAFQHAVEADSRYVTPYVSLAQLAGLQQDWLEMADMSERALQLDPVDSAEAYFFNAIANYNLSNFEIAERSAIKAQRLDTQHKLPYLIIILANLSEQKKDYSSAIQQLRTYLSLAPQSGYAEEARQRIRKLELEAQPVAGSPRSAAPVPE